MKKICLVVIVMCCILLPQEVTAVKLRFGVKADLIVSKLTTGYKTPYIDWSTSPQMEFSSSSYLGLEVGGVVKIDFWKGLGLDTGLGFSFLGGNANWGGVMVKTNEIGQVYENTMTYYSFTIPVCLRYRVDINSVKHIFAPSLFTGPVVQFKVGQKSMMSEDVSPVLLHWRLGVGFLIMNHIEVNAAYNIPLNNAFSFEGIIDNTRKYKTMSDNKFNYWSVGLAYIW